MRTKALILSVVLLLGLVAPNMAAAAGISTSGKAVDYRAAGPMAPETTFVYRWHVSKTQSGDVSGLLELKVYLTLEQGRVLDSVQTYEVTGVEQPAPGVIQFHASGASFYNWYGDAYQCSSGVFRVLDGGKTGDLFGTYCVNYKEYHDLTMCNVRVR